MTRKDKDTREFLNTIGIKDIQEKFPISTKTFSDKGHYRFEVPGIQTSEALNSLISASEEYGVKIHRATQTKGIFRLTDDEIEDMVILANSASLKLFLSVGPRATYDIGASAQTSEGSRIGYRLRGYENLVYAIEDVKRAVDLGVRGILLYDEGLLWVLNKMRNHGDLPRGLDFKVSAHMGHGNPASAKLLVENGADSINPVRDLPVYMLASIRDCVDVPLDIHTENPKSSGGFIRHYEVPDMIRSVAPVYLKTGGSVAKHHGWDTSSSQAKDRVKQVALVQSMIDKYYPEAVQSK